MSPDGAPLTPTPATTAVFTLTGAPPGRITKSGSAMRPGLAAACWLSAAVGLWNPAAACALPSATFTVAPVAPSARWTTMAMPSVSTTATVTAKPRAAQSCCAVVASCWAATRESTLRETTTEGAVVGVDDGVLENELDELPGASGRAADPGRDRTATVSATPVTAMTPPSVHVRFTIVLLVVGGGLAGVARTTARGV